MKKDIYAVITGDLVDSTAIRGNYKKALYQIAEDIKAHQVADLLFDIYRGDSFQALIPDPIQALQATILFRAGLRRNTRGKGLEKIWDARIAIGTGTINNLNPNTETPIGLLDGEAFIRSGISLDTMKAEGVLLKITTGDEMLDGEFKAACYLADTIIGRWSVPQADAVYLYLLENLTQKEIGKRLHKSQRAISKRLEFASIDNLMPFVKRYKQVIEWKYNN